MCPGGIELKNFAMMGQGFVLGEFVGFSCGRVKTLYLVEEKWEAICS